MCDSNCGGAGGAAGQQLSGPPANLPSWFKCPPVSQERDYPVPSGVEIKPISYGGRNGGSGGIKKKFKCGKCGDEEKPAAKPRASADCPMMRAGCPGLSRDDGKGFLAKLKEFFGIGKK